MKLLGLCVFYSVCILGLNECYAISLIYEPAHGSLIRNSLSRNRYSGESASVYILI